MRRGVLPLLGGVALTVVFVYGVIQYAKPDWLRDDNENNVTIFGFGAVAVVGIGALVLGVILMLVWWTMAPVYFQGRTLTRRSADLVLEPPEETVPTFGLPDSGQMETVIAPDLSNLPPGTTAIDRDTGAEFTKER